MIQSSRSNRAPQDNISNEKVAPKKEECESAINDTIENVEAARKVSSCLLESYR
jgi:hypothetical protein